MDVKKVRREGFFGKATKMKNNRGKEGERKGLGESQVNCHHSCGKRCTAERPSVCLNMEVFSTFYHCSFVLSHSRSLALVFSCHHSLSLVITLLLSPSLSSSLSSSRSPALAIAFSHSLSIALALSLSRPRYRYPSRSLSRPFALSPSRSLAIAI